MLRTALQPRWLALLVLALGLATVFALLGSWQLDRSRGGPSPTDERAVVELTDVATPQTTLEGEALLNDVRVRGTYRADQQLEVVDRARDGEPGSWVLTPLTVESDGGTATLAVVRGWMPDGAELPAPPSGTVEVVGRLQGSELPSGPQADLAPGQVRSVSAADLVNIWEPPIYAGYLVAKEPVPEPLRPVPVTSPGAGGGVNLLNVSYALQWWVFAGFAVFLWWRMVRDAHRYAAGSPADDETADLAEGRTDGRIEGRTDGRIEGQTDGRIEGPTDGGIEGPTDGGIEGQTDGQTDRHRSSGPRDNDASPLERGATQ